MSLYELSKKEKKSVFAELKTEYLFIAIPFVFLVVLKLNHGVWTDVVMSPEWSIASCLIFGQITSKVSKAVVQCSGLTNEDQFGWCAAKRFFWVVASVGTYCFMLTSPSLELGFFQLALFFLASFFHFKDGFATKILLMTSRST